MDIIKSIKGRISGLNDDLNSHYWEYIQHFDDGMVWEDTILFESFGGRSFQGNPYYLYKTAIGMDEFKHFRIYISHSSPGSLRKVLEQRQLIDGRVSIVERDGAEYRTVLSHAKYLVNNVSFSMDWIKKDDQVYLNTWHGTPLKCLGRRIENDHFEMNNSQRNMLLADLLLAQNEFTKGVYEDDYMIRGIMPGTIRTGGYPRNAAFFDEPSRQAVRQKHRLEGKTAIFYMPTWRGTASGVEQIDFVSDMERLAASLGEEYVVYVKLHPAMVGGLTNMNKCRRVPEEYEVYEFLNAMDILVTDYSSVYFDFANANRRTILYQPDKQEYEHSRGFYSEALADIPYPVASDLGELASIITGEGKVDDSSFRDTYCSLDRAGVGADLLRDLLKYRRDKGPLAVDLYLIDFRVTDEELLAWQSTLQEAGKPYRFVFVPRRTNNYFQHLTCFTSIDYLVCFDTARLLPWEHLATSGAAWRERRRLWGDVNINCVYMKGHRPPLALSGITRAWPNSL